MTPANPNDWFMLGSKNPAQMRAMAVDRARLEPLVRAALKDRAATAYLPALWGSLPLQPPEEGAGSTLADQATRAAALQAALGALCGGGPHCVPVCCSAAAIA